jgi:hypothetical protein
MSDKNIEEMKKLSREKLESLVISLWDDLVELRNKDRYSKHLESENERLNKAVHGIYQDLKMKSLRFMVDAKPNESTRDIFIDCFKKYIS